MPAALFARLSRRFFARATHFHTSADACAVRPLEVYLEVTSLNRMQFAFFNFTRKDI